MSASFACFQMLLSTLWKLLLFTVSKLNHKHIHAAAAAAAAAAADDDRGAVFVVMGAACERSGRSKATYAAMPVMASPRKDSSGSIHLDAAALTRHTRSCSADDSAHEPSDAGMTSALCPLTSCFIATHQEKPSTEPSSPDTPYALLLS